MKNSARNYLVRTSLILVIIWLSLSVSSCCSRDSQPSGDSLQPAGNNNSSITVDSANLSVTRQGDDISVQAEGVDIRTSGQDESGEIDAVVKINDLEVNTRGGKTEVKLPGGITVNTGNN